MGRENVVEPRDDDQPELLRLTTQETSSRRQSAGQLWLMLCIIGALVGAVLIGQCLALREWPWISLEVARKWTGAPICMAVMLRLEMDLSGRPGRLLLKFLSPLVLAILFGWGLYSPYVAGWVARVIG